MRPAPPVALLAAGLLAACGAPRPASDAAPDVRCDGSGLARTCEVAGLFADAPERRLTLTTGDGVPDTLVLALVRDGEPPRRLPTFHGSTVWGQCGPATDARDLPRRDRIAAGDVDGDGDDDLVVVAECMTGIGATGAQPFPVGAVYLGEGRDGWRTDPAVDSALTDLAQATCGSAGGRPGRDDVARCDVRALAVAALRHARP